MSAREAQCSQPRIVYFSSLFVLVSGYPRERRSCAIQSREAYFAGIAAPCEGFGVLAPAVLPSASSPASSAPPRWSLERERGAGWRRSPGRSTTGGLGRRRSRDHGRGNRACQRAHGSLSQRYGVSFQITQVRVAVFLLAYTVSPNGMTVRRVDIGTHVDPPHHTPFHSLKDYRKPGQPLHLVLAHELLLAARPR